MFICFSFLQINPSMNFNLYDPFYRSFRFFICILFWFFFRWFFLLCFHVTFFRRPQHRAHCGGDRGGGCWRPWLRSLESHGLRVFNGFSASFLLRTQDNTTPRNLSCTMPSKWHKFEAVHVLQLPWCRTGLCLVLIVCMPLGRIKLISFIFFIRMFVAQGQTTNKCSSDQNLTNHLVEEETEHYKVPRLSSHDPLIFFLCHWSRIFSHFFRVFSNQPRLRRRFGRGNLRPFRPFQNWTLIVEMKQLD